MSKEDITLKITVTGNALEALYKIIEALKSGESDD